MIPQPEALRLADWLEADACDLQTPRDAAAELRRLYEVNQELLEALEKLANVFHEGQVFPRNGAAGYVESTLEFAEAAIAKAEENA